MNINGYILKRKSDQAEISRWPAIPSRIDINDGTVVFSADASWENEFYKIEAVTWTAEDPRRLIDKSLILERLTDKQLADAIGAMTQRQRERWRMPGSPQVYVDDPELIAVLTYVGADLEMVLAV